MGRVDYELRKMYIDENVMNPIPPEYRVYVQRINQELFMRVYRPVIMEGIRSKTLLSFNCDDIRTETDKGPMQFYDIVHFASPMYLHKRCALLSEFLEASYFQEWWNSDAEHSLRHSWNTGAITQKQYTQELAETLLKALRQRPDIAPSHLVHLTTELIKLATWESSHEKQLQQEKKRLELNSLFSTLQKMENIYQVRDKKWIKENMETILSLLRSKVPGVLACTHPYINPFQIGKDFDPIASGVSIYLLLKDKKASANAIEAAEKLRQTNQDITLLRVLENLFGYHTESRGNLKEYIAPIHLNRFEEALSRCYLPNLSWLSQLYYGLVGKTLSKAQIAKLKAKLDLKEKRTLVKRNQNNPKSLGSSLLSSDMQQAIEEKQAIQRRSLQELEKGKESPEEKALVEKSCRFLEEEWGKNRYPSRQNLIAMAGEEESLMKKILSLTTLDAQSSRPIVSIDIHERGRIYASRAYLRSKRSSLIRNLSNKMEKEETYKINEKTYLSTEFKNKALYKGIIEYLKRNPNL